MGRCALVGRFLRRSGVVVLWILWGASAWCAEPASGIRFRTRLPGYIDLPLVDAAGQPVAGGDYWIQLYLTPPGAPGAVPFGDPVRCGTGAAAGYVAMTPDPIIPLGTLEPGSWVTVELRAWRVGFGDTFEQAAANGSLIARSARKTMVVPAEPTIQNLVIPRPFSLFDARSRLLFLSSYTWPMLLGGDVDLTILQESRGLLIPPISVLWKKNGQPFAVTSEPEYLITRATFDDSGTYQAFVTDAAGTVVSRSTDVAIVPRVIRTSVLPSRLQRDQPVRVELDLAGCDDCRFRWVMNGTTIADDTGPSVEISPARVGQLDVYFGPSAGQPRDRYLERIPLEGATIKVGDHFGGSVTWSPITDPAGVLPGTEVTFTAKASQGFDFLGWAGGLSGVQNPLTAVVTSNLLIEAWFRPYTGMVSLFSDPYELMVRDWAGKPLGSGYSGQYYVGLSPNALAPFGEPATFGSPVPGMIISPGTVFLPTIPVGATAYIQLRVWNRAAGADFEQALRAGASHVGWSRIIHFVASGAGLPPTPVTNLKGLIPFWLAKEVVVTNQPGIARAGIGQPASWEVRVEGTGPIDYQWFRDGEPIPGGTNSVLRLESVSAADLGEYRVRAGNLLNAAWSETGHLEIVPQPRIVEQQVSANPRRGSPLQFSVRVEGGEDLNYSWMLDGQPLAPATPQGEFRVEAAETGTYSVLVRGLGGEVRQDLVTLAPSFWLRVEAQGGQVTVVPAEPLYSPGTRVQLTAIPDPGAVFQGWGGDVAVVDNPLELVMTNDVRLEAQFLLTAGTIYFVNRALIDDVDAPVYDEDGVTRLEGERFAVQLYASPIGGTLVAVGERRGFRSGSAAGYFSGDRLVLPWLSGGEPAEVQVRAWEASAGDSYEAAVMGGGKHGESATFTVVTGNRGSPPTLPAPLVGLKSFALHRGEAPTLQRSPASVTAELGRSLELEVQARGSEPLFYQWIQGDLLLPGATNRFLRFRLESAASTGAYRVEVRNRFGVVSSEVAEVALPRIAQGTIAFRNREPGAVLDAPVLDGISGERLEGEAFLAECLAGNTNSELQGVGPAVGFGAGPSAGYFDGGIRALPKIAPGDLALVQVRVWESAGGATYAEALRPGIRVGESEILRVVTGNAGEPPTPAALLAGLTSFTIQPARPAQIVTPPDGRRVRAGSPLELRVVAAGHPAPQIKWLKDGAALPDATQTSWRIEAATLADAGSYSVRVTNALGGETSATVPVSVSTDPVLALAWTNTTVFAGQSLVIEVGVDGAPPFHFDWYAGSPGDTSVWLGEVERWETGVLTASARYWVRVRDANGVVDSPALVVDVTRQAQAIPWTGPDQIRLGDSPLALPSLSSAGLFVEWQVVSGPAEIQDNALVVLETGEIQLRGSQAGDDLYLPAENFRTTVRVVPGFGVIRGLAFTDRDGDGRRSAQEPPAEGIEFLLTGRGLGEERRATSAADGTFEFLEVPPGKRTLQLGPGTTDRQITTSGVRGFQVGSQLTSEVAVGLQPLGTVQGIVFQDLDGDGQRGDAEPGLAGVTVHLMADVGPAENRRTTTTSAEGWFVFEQVPAGAYRLEEADPEGFISSTPDLLSVFVSEAHAAAVLFGDQAAQSITGVVFEDRNGDGIHQAEEPGISDIAVRLLRRLDESVIAEAVTVAGGYFAFTGLVPGDYVVQQVASASYTVLANGSARAQHGATSSGDPELGNSDHAVVLDPGAAVALQFALQPVRTLTGRVFEDADGDGSQDPGENGLGQVRLRLREGDSGRWLGVVSTDAGGFYVFTNLAAGRYHVVALAPEGFRRPSGPTLVTLVPGGAAIANVGLSGAGTLSGLVFNDQDQDGRYAAAEPGLEGCRVRWSAVEAGVAPREAWTWRDGRFEMTDVPALAGELTLEVPSGWRVTTTNRLVVAEGGHTASALFGVRSAAVIPIRWLVEPADQEVAPGGTLALSAVADGTGPLGYQWYKDGSPVPGARSMALLLTPARPEDTGTYQLHATNAVGRTLTRRISVRVRLNDPYLDWARAHLASEVDHAPTADPDRDGASNVEEFLAGTPPDAPEGTRVLPRLVALPRGRPAVIGFELHRSHQARGLELGLEASADLVAWERVEAVVTMVGPGADSDVVRVVVAVNPGLGGRLFFRLTLSTGVAPPDPAQLRIFPRKTLAGPSLLELRGQAGRAYLLEFSEDLRRWNPAGEWVTGTAPLVIPTVGTGGEPALFYRASPR